MSKTHTAVWFEANWKHIWIWFLSLGQQNHAFLGSTLPFIQVIWFTYVFAISLQDAVCI